MAAATSRTRPFHKPTLVEGLEEVALFGNPVRGPEEHQFFWRFQEFDDGFVQVELSPDGETGHCLARKRSGGT